MKIYDMVLQDINKICNILYGREIAELDFPPDINLGDFTINCFLLAKDLKKSPNLIAAEIGDKLKEVPHFEKVEVTGAYVNIQIKNDILFKNLLNNSGKTKVSKQKIMIEYLQPNTNKPLHLGHVRNGCLGMSLSNTLSENGFEVVKANLINDRGIHISKSMLAWQKWGEGETPQSAGMKGDHFVGKWYVRYSKEAETHPEFEDEARELLKKWEDGDAPTLELWKKMNSWVYTGFGETNTDYGFIFDEEYFESNTYKLGKEIISEGLQKKIFYKDDNGNTVVDLPEDRFGKDQNGELKKVTLQRGDGTSLYMTQDLGTAKLKFEKHDLERSIYVVGSEQEYHFKCLFEILAMLGYEFAKKCYHLSYGMVYLPEGKMKSREGKVVDADDLLKEMEQLAKEEISSRTSGEKLKDDEIALRSQIIALSAIKFYLLKTNPRNDIYFNPKDSISFDGFTGPYCQYAYARASKILQKSGTDNFDPEKVDLKVLGNNEERLILQKIINLEKQTILAAEELNPSKIASAVYDLAVAFNRFYQTHSVIGADNKLKNARILIVDSTRGYIKKGLQILGIDVLEEM